MMFLFSWVIFRFHVNFPGCIVNCPDNIAPENGWLEYVGIGSFPFGAPAHFQGRAGC